MSAYYNEHDPFAAAWLRELIKAKLIADGEVDERSITEVKADEIKGFTQCHFFAGIGGWSLALRLAGWNDSRPVWTGSCPCQPFSSAGAKRGKEDARHLFPTWLELIRQCYPATIFGEQVTSAIAHGWLDDVYQGLEACNYAVGSAVLPACGVGAPHRRDRLWFVADAQGSGCGWRSGTGWEDGSKTLHDHGQGDMADTASTEFRHIAPARDEFGDGKLESAVANASGRRCGGEGEGKTQQSWRAEAFWSSSSEWIKCTDGKARLVEPSIPLLAYGVSHRMGKLRGYGNAIIPQEAAEFIMSVM